MKKATKATKKVKSNKKNEGRKSPVCVSFTAKEFSKIVKLAKTDKVSKSSYVRNVLLKSGII